MSKRARGGLGACAESSKHLSGSEEAEMIAQVADAVAAEAVADAWRQISSMNNGPRVISLRAGNVIGGGDFSNDRLLPDIVRSYIAGSTLIIRNLESTRPWQHVLDPLLGYVLAVENSSKNSL